jgi:Leucine-rich repeat (LRR) protein
MYFMRLPRFASAFRRRLRRQSFTPLELAAIARNPSYRAPAAADLRDEMAFQPPSTDAPPQDWGARDLVYRDGQLVGLSLSGRAFIAGRHWFERNSVTDVTLVAVQPFLEELAKCPHLANLRRLDLTGCRIRAEGARVLAGSAFLSGLRELILSKNDLGHDGLAALASAPWFADLTVLELAENNLREPDAQARDQLTPCLRVGLRELDLSDNRFPFGSKLPTGLHRLKLARSGLGVEEVRRLVGSGTLDSVTDLDVHFNNIGPDGAVALDSMRSCKCLNLAFNDLEDAGAETLADGELPLEWLDLSANRITPLGAKAMAASHAFESVQSLNLSVNPIGDDGALALMLGEGLGSLANLNLANCRLTDSGALDLARSGTLGGLTRLSLAWNAIGDAGVRALATCPDLSALRELDLTGTPIGYAGAIALADSRYLVSLRTIALGENSRLPVDGVRLIEERFGTIS